VRREKKKLIGEGIGREGDLHFLIKISFCFFVKYQKYQSIKY
jgi:hypothetical protein